MTVDCTNCPLRRHSVFQEFSKEDLAFMERFKMGELVAQPGTEILAQGASSSQLFTVLNGLGLRFKTLQNGDRQVVGFVLPGDFIGLQSGVMEEMRHTVEASSMMTLCVFNRSDLWSLFKHQPSRAFDLAHLAALEENLLGEALSAVGQLNGTQKVAWALHRFYSRLSALGLARNGSVPFPYRQRDLADALGLSLVHTNKTLAKLKGAGILTWEDGMLLVRKEAELAHMAHVLEEPSRTRPLI